MRNGPQSAHTSRRSFLKFATTAAAATLAAKVSAQTVPATSSQPATSTGPATTGRGRGRGPNPPAPLPMLGNGEPPAMTFQPYAGGTGAYLEKVIKERGVAAFERKPMKVEAFVGAVPGTEEEIAFLPVHRLAALIEARKLSPVDLTRIYLDRLKMYDPKLLCAVTIMEGPAKEAAQQVDSEIKSGNYKGPLHGIPWGVKDLFAVKGTPTTWGAAEFKDRVIDEDSEVVVRLRNAGAILIAKLATGRFAQGDQWYRGRTNNPWNPAVGSSGSSAGPASATAAGCVGFGIGTETRGSIVSPASVCGLCALRPTYGRVSRQGGMVLAWTMDRLGPICRSVEDCALVFNVIHGVDEKDPTTVTVPFQFERSPDLAKIRIGYDTNAPAAVLDKLRQLGANPRPIGPRPNVPPGMNSLDSEDASAFEGDLASGALKDVDGGRFTGGRNVSAIEFLRIQRHREILVQNMAKVMADFDVYLTATELGNVTLCSMTGNPAVVVPYSFAAGRGRGGAPGVEQPQCTVMVGNVYADDKLLSVASAYERATDWHTRHPKLTA